MSKKKGRPQRDFRARLVIYDAPQMTEEQREEIRSWLYHQGSAVVNDGHNYVNNFTARFMNFKKEDS